MLSREERRTVRNSLIRLAISLSLFIFLLIFAKSFFGQDDGMSLGIMEMDDVTVASPKGELIPQDVLINRDANKIKTEIINELNLSIPATL